MLLSDTAIGLRLEDGQIQRLDDKDPSSFIAANFDEYIMSISLLRANTRRLRVGEMSSTKLLRRLHQLPLDQESIN